MIKHTTADIRDALADIHRVSRAELANLPLSAARPTISRMIEALTYTDAERRGDAVDDLTRLLGECWQRIHRCAAIVEAEEEREAGERKRLALVG